MASLKQRSHWVAAALAAVLACASFMPAQAAAPKPVISKAVKGERCVEPTDYMRRNHMKVLDGHRDKTVLEGVRSKKYSLKECINCHASEKSGSVATAKEDFCVSCHSYAAVKIDCFECHSTKPQGSVAMHAMNPQTAHYKHQMAAQSGSKISAEEMAGIAK